MIEISFLVLYPHIFPKPGFQNPSSIHQYFHLVNAFRYQKIYLQNIENHTYQKSIEWIETLNDLVTHLSLSPFFGLCSFSA